MRLAGRITHAARRGRFGSLGDFTVQSLTLVSAHRMRRLLHSSLHGLACLLAVTGAARAQTWIGATNGE